MKNQTVPRPLKHLVHARSYVQHWPVTITVEQFDEVDETNTVAKRQKLPAYIVEVKARKAKRNMYILATDDTSPSFIKRAAERNTGPGWRAKIKHPKQNIDVRLWLHDWYTTDDTQLCSLYSEDPVIFCYKKIPSNV